MPSDTEVIKKVLQRYKQEVKSLVEENIEDAIRNFSETTVSRCWLSAQNWCKWSNDGPVLMPNNVRLYYRRSITEVLIVEIPPQLRLLRFKNQLIDNPGNPLLVNSYTLALPYIDFIFRFEDGLFQHVVVTFCDRPLKTLKEHPQRPYLPNISDHNLVLCLGNNFNKDKLERHNITQQSSYVMNHFWDTVFSKELTDNYDLNREHFAKDTRLCNLEAWEKASIENPLFVLDDVEWINFGDQNFGDLIASEFGDAKDQEIQRTVYEDIIDTLSTTIYDKVMSQMDFAEKKVEDYIQKLCTE